MNMTAIVKHHTALLSKNYSNEAMVRLVACNSGHQKLIAALGDNASSQAQESGLLESIEIEALNNSALRHESFLLESDLSDKCDGLNFSVFTGDRQASLDGGGEFLISDRQPTLLLQYDLNKSKSSHSQGAENCFERIRRLDMG